MASYQKIHGKIKALPDDILVKNMKFGNRITKGGIFIVGSNAMKESEIRPRWAEVYDVGNNVDGIKKGQYVLIAHGRWTYAINVVDSDEEIKLQKIDKNAILLVSNEYVDDEYTE